MTPAHLALIGPTASGKSAVAFAAARMLGDVEIVSLDSMQVYRGMDVGTAKPSLAERRAVPHHVIDVVEPSTDWSAAQHQSAARAAVSEIDARGRRALLVGGTGLYVQAVVDDLRFPGEDLDLRSALEARAAEPGGAAAAYAELERLDPKAAAKIDPHNARRIVRALEVIHLTSKPFSSFGPGVASFGPTAFSVRMAGVWLPRPVIDARISARVAEMLDSGLVEEVRTIAEHDGGFSRTAGQAIGYKEVLAYLSGVAPSIEDASELIVRRTRSFARRQRMWFRRDPRIAWYAVPRNPCDVLPALLAAWTR